MAITRTRTPTILPGGGEEASHGTHCAGLVAAQANNKEGVAGAAGASGSTQIMGIRISDDEAGGFYTASIAACYEYLVRARLAGVNVVAANDSWGSDTSYYDPVLDYLVNQAGKVGVLSCFASGNSGIDSVDDFSVTRLESPYAILVGASNSDGNLVYFSNYDETAVDLAAPGSFMLSTVPNASTANFNALVSHEAGKADKLSYYTDIAEKYGTDGFKAQLATVSYDKETEAMAITPLSNEAQAALTVSPVDEAENAYVCCGEKALKVTVDYDALSKIEALSSKLRVVITWPIKNPFKGLDGLAASDYAMTVTVRGLDMSDADSIIAGDVLATTDLKTSFVSTKKSYMEVDSEDEWLYPGTLSSIDTADDYLLAGTSVYRFEYHGSVSDPSGKKSFLVTGCGIGKNTAATNPDSAYAPYAYMSGTSMATPTAAGCIAELAALYPNSTALQLRGRACGGTALLTSKESQAKVASGGRISLECALDDAKVNANTWSITTSGSSVTVHGYNLDDAKLFVDKGDVAVTPTSQSASEITFNADASLFDGASHRFDVTDGTTGRTYRAAYVMPDGMADSLVRIHSLPTVDNASEAQLVADSSHLFYADARGSYLYACANPQDPASGWEELDAPGLPWSGEACLQRRTIKYAYADGRLYAFASNGSTAQDGTSQAVFFAATYDISTSAWSAWAEIGRESCGSGEGVPADISSMNATGCNGSAYCLVVFAMDSDESKAILFESQPGGAEFRRIDLSSDELLWCPEVITSSGGALHCLSASLLSDNTYQIGLVSLDAAAAKATSAGAVAGMPVSASQFEMVSLESELQTGAGNGIVMAGLVAKGMGDIQLISTTGAPTATNLGSYGLSSASGLTVCSMAMFGSKLYMSCVSHAGDSSGDASASALFTLPASATAALSTVDAVASAKASSGGTAAVSDWQNAASSSITMRAGDIATWTATSDSAHKFAGWYGADGALVSSDAAYSAPVSSDTELTARFTTGRVVRLWGETALDTMSDIVLAGFSGRGGTVVLCTSENFPDALTAAGIAGLANAPVLLTTGAQLSAQTGKVLDRLRPDTIIVCGGANAVSESTAQAARKAAGALHLFRCAGESRSETAVEAYLDAKAYTGAPFSTTAIVATGNGFADALSIAPYAYSRHCAIFLAESDGSISDGTLHAMKAGGIASFYVVGGTGVVPDSAVKQLTDAGIGFAGRLSGKNRYQTSLAIAKFELSHGMTADGVSVATGQNYKDALAGAAVCGRNGSVLLLASDDDLSTLDGVIPASKAQISSAYIFGGTAVVSQKTEDYMNGLLE